ncbi:M20/M25/M40 family metallo-hydrolase [Salinispira pacifica]
MELLQLVLDQFEQLCRIPRCSSDEGPVRRWLREWAALYRLEVRTDSAGNLCVEIPPSEGRERDPGLVLQAHQDMVCAARSDGAYDFSTGVSAEREGDWLLSRDTSLGADDGMGIALITAVCGALISSEHSGRRRHEPKKAAAAAGSARAAGSGNPPIELLFTSSEESGMSGASGLRPGFLRGRRMLNLDSETEGAFTVGCAGMRYGELVLPLRRFQPAVRSGRALFRIELHGAAGGHSATDIHRSGANAVLLAARLLPFLARRCEMHLIAMKAGNAPNMIARDAELKVAVPAGTGRSLVEAVAAAEGRFREEFAATDPQLQFTCTELSAAGGGAALTAVESTNRLSELLLGLPHGVMRLFDAPEQGLIHTSVNVAGCELSEGSSAGADAKIGLSVRGADSSGLDQARKRIESVAALAGARVSFSGEMEPWHAREASETLDRALAAYRNAHGSSARTEFAHGVLECGIIAKQIPDMDMISTGPTIEGAHAPGERVSISSIERVARFLREFVTQES